MLTPPTTSARRGSRQYSCSEDFCGKEDGRTLEEMLEAVRRKRTVSARAAELVRRMQYRPHAGAAHRIVFVSATSECSAKTMEGVMRAAQQFGFDTKPSNRSFMTALLIAERYTNAALGCANAVLCHQPIRMPIRADTESRLESYCLTLKHEGGRDTMGIIPYVPLQSLEKDMRLGYFAR